MKTMIVLMGIQGSGKSEYYRQYLSQQYIRVNLDTLHTRAKERLLVSKCLETGTDFAVDNTNPTREDRARYIAAAKAAGYHIVGIFMESKLQECIRRNNLREGKACIPASAIAATSNKLELPSYDEGFDELYFVANDGVTMRKEKWRESK